MAATFPVKVTFEAVDKLTAKINQINQNVRDKFKPVTQAQQKFSRLGESLGLDPGSMGRTFDVIGDKISGVKDALKGLAITATVVGGGLGATVGFFGKYADELSETSAQVGMNTTRLQEYMYAAQRSNVTQDELSDSFRKLKKSIVDGAIGSGDAADVFRALRIETKNASGQLKTVDELLPEIADKFKTIKSDQVKSFLSEKIFGKNSRNFVGFLSQGADAIKNLRSEASKKTTILSPEEIEAGAKFNDTLKVIGKNLIDFRNVVGSGLVGPFQKLADAVQNFFVENKDTLRAFGEALGQTVQQIVPLILSGLQSLTAWMQRFSDMPVAERVEMITNAFKVLAFVAVLPLASSLLSLVASFGTIVSAVSPLLAVVGTMIAAFMKFGLVLLANPITWYVAGILALGAAVYLLVKYWDDVVGAMSKAWDWFKKLLGFSGAEVNVNGTQTQQLLQAPAKGTPIGADQAFQQMMQNQANKNESTIKVDFTNLPKGTTVVTDTNKGTNLDLSQGFAMVN